MPTPIRYWIPLAIASFALSFISYALVQQTLRLSVDDPQIQLSEDIATATAEGKNTATLMPPTNNDISKSLAPFVMLFDESGNSVSSTGLLDGSFPELPKGVLDYAKAHQQDRITWEPKKGVRLATVVTYFSGHTSGYILAARSLREVEEREQVILRLVNLGLGGTLLATLIAAYVFIPDPDKKRKSN